MGLRFRIVYERSGLLGTRNFKYNPDTPMNDVLEDAVHMVNKEGADILSIQIWGHKNETHPYGLKYYIFSTTSYDRKTLNLYGSVWDWASKLHFKESGGFIPETLPSKIPL